MKLLVHTVLTIALLHVARAIAPHQEPWTGLFALLLANDHGITLALALVGTLHKYAILLWSMVVWATLHWTQDHRVIDVFVVPGGAGIALGLLIRKQIGADEPKGEVHARPPEPVPERRTQPAPHREPERPSGRGRGAGG